MVYGSSALVLLASADWRLTPPILLWFAGYAGILCYFVPRLRERSRAVSEMRSMLTGRVVDSYTNILTVKLFARARDEDAFVREAVDLHTGAFRDQTRMITGYVVLAGGDERDADRRHRGAGDLAVERRAHLGRRGGDGAAADLADHQHGRLGGAQRHLDLREHRHGAGRHALDRGASGRCRTRRTRASCASRGARSASRTCISTTAGVRRPGDRGGVLHGIDLRIAPGERVGLVGPSGAGKSTLVNLLLHFYDPERGRILIDGQDIATVTQESLRTQIAMVTQDTSLLHRSIRDNIRYGRPQATQAMIEDAARRAEAHEFIVGLEDWHGRRGFDAHVGERGVKLSGGQRQRMALARVILKDAPILVLDEATSALDSEVEAAIQEPARRADGGAHGDRHRAPAVHHCAHGPAGGARSRPHRGGRHACRAAGARRHLCAAVAAAVRRVHAGAAGRGGEVSRR